MKRIYLLIIALVLSLAFSGCDSGADSVGSVSNVNFVITEQTNVAVDTNIVSATIVVSGIDGTVTVTASGGWIVKNGINVGTSTTMTAADTIAAGIHSSTDYNTVAAMYLVIDGISRTFTVTTGSENIPNTFNFGSKTNADLSTDYTSATITISGLDAPVTNAIFNDGGNNATLYVNGVSWPDGAPVELDNTDTVYIVMTSSSNYSKTLSCSLTIGSMTRSYSVATMALPTLTVSPATVSLNFGQTQQLTTAITPSTLVYNVTWASSNSAIASVNSSGLVSAVSGGTATITATATVVGHADIIKSIVVAVNSTASITQKAHYTGSNPAVVDVVLNSTDTKAFLANSLSGISVIDINTVNTTTFMTQIGSLDLPSYSEGVALSADDATLFVATGYDGLNILSVATPTAPTLTGTYNTGYTGTGKYAWKVTLSSDESIAYVANCAGLDAIDISTLAAPTLLDELNISGGDCNTIAMDEHPYDVVLNSRNKLAYLAYGTAGVQVISTIDPTAMDVNATYTGCADAKSVDLSLDDNYLFVACGTDGVNIVNVSDSSAPVDEANVSMLTSEDSAVDIKLSPDGSFLYVSYGGGVMMVDVSDPANPALVANYASAGKAYATTPDSADAYFYTSDGSNGLLKLQLTY